MTTFRQLLERQAARLTVPRPRTLQEMTELLGISRTFLFLLMRGQRGASPEMVANIAKRLDVSENTVRKALREAASEKSSLLD